MSAPPVPVPSGGPGDATQLLDLGNVSASFVAGSNDTVQVSWGNIFVPKEQGTVSLNISFATNGFFQNATVVPVTDTTTTSLSHTNSWWQYAPKVWVQLAATLTSPSQPTKTYPVSSVVAASQIATLQSVTNVSLNKVAATVTGVAVNRVGVSFDVVPNCFQYAISIYTNETPAVSLYNGFAVPTGSGTNLTTQVDLFSPDVNGMPVGKVQGAICQVTALSPDHTQFTNSAPASSSGDFPIICYLSNVTATFAAADSNRLSVGWAQSVATKFCLRAFVEDYDYVWKEVTTAKTGLNMGFQDITPLVGLCTVAVQPVDVPESSYAVSTFTQVQIT